MTYFLFSLGCKVNSYEIEAVRASFNNLGYQFDDKNPDIVVVNTCSVTAIADQKSRQHIRKFKNLYPNAVLVVMGCFVQGHQDLFDIDVPGDIVIGTSKRNMIISYVNKYLQNHQRIVDICDDTRNFKYEELGEIAYSNNVRCYLKISDGCDNFCSYCLIPYRRGKLRSRDYHHILNEAKLIYEKGYHEIVLTGIHVGGYGQDNDEMSFSSLVEKILDIGIDRLRISSIEESEIDDKLISLMATRKNLAKHFHIPLQSGSDLILKKMNRKYNCEQFLAKINLIKAKMPHVCLTTDVIVGFPGETDEEFENTRQFILKCGFSSLHVFPFSKREDTVAYSMSQQIDPKIKKKRVSELVNLSNKLWNDYSSLFNNQEIEVLFEQYDPKSKINKGHSSSYLEVEYQSDEDLTNKMCNIIYHK